MQPTFAPPPLERPRGLGALIGAALRRPGGRRTLTLLSVVLMVAGVCMFGYPVYTDYVAGQKQDTLRSAFTDPGYAERYRLRQIRVGEVLTRLHIPSQKIDVLVVEGTSAAALKAGAGHYPGTPLPGEAGNVAIAGHRTTYGRPFSQLNEMKAGDVVELETPGARFTYKVVPSFSGHANPWVVTPKTTGVVAQSGADHWLTLTTCHPKGSAKQRLVLRLTLTKTELKRGAGAPKSKS